MQCPPINTPSLKQRCKRLQTLKEILLNHEESIHNAFYSDLKRAPTETFLTEIHLILAEINFAIKNLHRWAAPLRVKTPIVLIPARSYIYPEPKGKILIISPWNYPFLLSLSPLVSALAAGNTVTLKPSELAPATSHLLKELIGNYFDSEIISVIEGGAKETIELLKQPFDHIFYTGNATVAKEILAQAAQNLTPVTLELGGKSPCIVTTQKHLDLAAKRIVWAKFMNAGQTCVAPDYVLILPHLKKAFLESCKKYILEFYSDSSHSEDYTKIINLRHFNRLIKLLESVSKNQIIVGGKHDRDNLYIEPTLFDLGTLESNLESKIMESEIFGPILPILEIKNIDTAIRLINLPLLNKPLALYLFSDCKKQSQEIISNIKAGGICINDCNVQLASPYLPFGGIGNSGMGAYHGKFGFDLFSHKKAVLKRYFRFDLFFRYPPFSKNYKLIKLLLRWL